MATHWDYICYDDHKNIPGPPCLFYTLFNFSKEKQAPKCKCEKNRELYLTFPFELGAGTWTYKVLDVYLPVDQDSRSWTNEKDGSKATFYPFLAVMEYAKNKNPDDKSGKVFWLPYWHTVEAKNEKRKLRYGQWAPSLDHIDFRSLLEQAQARFPDFLGPKR